MNKTLLIADLFCGAGGSSTGAVKAVRELHREVTLVCVNHWPIAIETHKKNHPEARHYVEDIEKADPYKIVPEGYLDLLMASPECRYFSRARGDKAINDQQRSTAWKVLDWLTKLNVRCVLIENVPEFTDWGPLDADDRPVQKKKGQYFQAFIKTLRGIGYKSVQWKFLNAADYGDATTRTRFFLIARKDSKPIRWPEATHSESGDLDMFGQLPRWRAARDIINWDNPGRSLLDDPRYQKKPLSEKTLKRIARGLEKFGGQLAPLYIQLLGLQTAAETGGSAQPFIMGKQSNPAYRGLEDPLQTITTDGKPMLIEPLAKPFVVGQQSCSAARNTDQPIPTVAGAGAISLIEPTLVKYYGTGDISDVNNPLPTVTTKDRFGLVTPMAFVVQNRIRPDGDRVFSLEKPCCTVTSHGAGALVNPVLVEVNHEGQDRAKPVDKPLGTVTTKRGTAIVNPFMVQWDQTGSNGSCVRPVDAPLATIVTKKNTGLVEPVIEAVESGKIDPRRLILIDGEPYLLDLRFRMLENIELARAMGFTDEESTYEFIGNKSEVTKQIGNAVPVNLAKALVKAVLG